MQVAQQSAVNEGTWREFAPFPFPTWELEGVESHGNIYLIGGITNAWGAKSGWVPNRMVYAYDPKADEWIRKAPIPVGIHHMALAETGGLIYGFGGYRTPEQGPDAWEPVANAWRYDPLADTWTALAPLPAARGAAAAAAINGRIYIAGGSFALKRRDDAAPQPSAPHGSSAQVYVYDPATDSYAEAAPLLTARNHHLLEAVGGKLYALGGRVGSSNAFTLTNRIDLVEEYDPADDTWWPRARMLAPHGGMVSCVHNDAIYVSGGDGIRMIEKYDVRADQWTVTAQLPRPRLGGSGGCVDGRFHVITGHVRTPEGSEPVPDHIALELD